MFERELGAMNGCRGGSAASTGRCVAGEPMNAFSEPACGPSGIGAGGAATAGAAAASSTKAMSRPVRTAAIVRKRSLEACRYALVYIDWTA